MTVQEALSFVKHTKARGSKWAEPSRVLRDEVLYQREVIVTLYLALVKECWQEGPSQSEAEDVAHDWLWNYLGDPENAESACEEFWKLYRLGQNPGPKKKKSAQEAGRVGDAGR